MFTVVSPDGHVQVEDFSGGHEDIAAVRYASIRSDVPPGVLGCLLHKFDEDIAPDLMVEYRRVARGEAEQYWIAQLPGQTLVVYMAAVELPPPVAQRQPQQIASGPSNPRDPSERDEKGTHA